MKLLVVNVNTTAAMTASIGRRAERAASPGTEIVALTPRFGPESVEGNFESYLAAVGVMDAVARYEGDYDAVIQAGFGEHGREGLQELVAVPVIDITEAAAHVACLLGRRYAVVTSLERTVGQIEDRLRLAGLLSRCAAIRATGLGVLELESSPMTVVDTARRAVVEDRADVIVLGCGGMAGLEDLVAERVDVPVVEGVSAAVRLAESLVGLGLRPTPLAPSPKHIEG
ncbi:MAG: Asp/Glu/hydantoin racemase, partial [Nonomuraea sp.]|nr:Asp/Glu/hydantoin racemase [Nonomuraea sp.]